MIKGTRTLAITLEVLVGLFREGPPRSWSVDDGLPADAHVVGIGMRGNLSDDPGLVLDLLIQSDKFEGHESEPLVPIFTVKNCVEDAMTAELEGARQLAEDVSGNG